MRIASPLIPTALLALYLSGCPEHKEQPTSHTGPEYKSASEGFKAAVPSTDNLPNKKALDNMQRTMEQSDKSQQRYEDKAAAAGQAE